jgi:exonuclease SbcC
MIPRTIQIQNFLSYGSTVQTIDFSPHHLICLSGKNGHGKSALLDAITWALWGQARKVSSTVRADQGLLRLGQRTMMVSLDFELHTVIYRVKRLFEIVYGKPYLSLELGMYTDTDTFVSLTEKTVRDTQARIDKITNLSFDTFVNSAFLRQGNANEFSKRSPKERKEIIVSILGLGIYDVLRKAAYEKTKQAHTEKQLLIALQQHRHETLQQWKQQENERQQILHSIQITHAEYVATIDTVDGTEQKMASLQKSIHLHIQHIEELTQSTASLSTDLDTLRAQYTLWRTNQRYITHTIESTEKEKKQAALLLLVQKQREIQQEHLLLKEQIIHTEGNLQKEQYALEQALYKEEQEIQLHIERLHLEQQNTTQQYKMLKNQQTKLNEALKASYETTDSLCTKLAQLASTQRDTISEITHYEKRKATYQRWSALGKYLYNQHILMVQKIEWQQSNNPSCPLCEQSLSSSRKRFLYTKLSREMHNISYKLDRLKQLLPRLKDMVVNDHVKMTQQQQIDIEHSATQQALAQEMRTQQELLQLLTTVAHQEDIFKTKNTYLEREIEKMTYSITLISSQPSKQLQEIKQKIDALSDMRTNLLHRSQAITYDQAVHEQLITEWTTSNQHKTGSEWHVQQERKKNIQALCRHIKSQRKKQTDLTIAVGQKQISEEQYFTCQQHYETLKTKAVNITKIKEELIHKKGILDAQCAKFQQIHDEYQAEQQKIAHLDTVLDDYTMIAHAASKDGIQALLIEDALPEIEHEANNILAKLTNNNAHVMIESVRDLKKGGTKETLDIKISDSAGIRPYELFSGGEAFRIDFALRIAISKLLARRAGADLQTLIIDEGFGSQDEEGLSLIMDTLYAIQEEFAKIIIVSHLPHMKDHFPVHFVIEKYAGTSMVTVFEQG